jgi:hypothetical protein
MAERRLDTYSLVAYPFLVFISIVIYVCTLVDHLLYRLVKLHIAKYYVHFRLKIKWEEILKYGLFDVNFTHAQNEIGSWLLQLQTGEKLSDANFTDKTAEIQFTCYAASYSKPA